MNDSELLEYCRTIVDANTTQINDLISRLNVVMEKLEIEYGSVVSDAYYTTGQTITLYVSSGYIASRCVLMLYNGEDLIETTYIYTTSGVFSIIGNEIKNVVSKSGNNINVVDTGDYRLRAVLYA